jgi:hypothetical protein
MRTTSLIRRCRPAASTGSYSAGRGRRLRAGPAWGRSPRPLPAATPAAARGAAEFLRRDSFPDRTARPRPAGQSAPTPDASLFRFEAARRGVAPNFPPYGLTVLAEQLQRVGVQVRIVQPEPRGAEGEPRRRGAGDVPRSTRCGRASSTAAIEAFQPDLIGVTCMFTMTHESLRQVCTWASRSGVPVAIGGVHVTNDVERVLDSIPAAQFAFLLREGDQAVQQFVRVARDEAEIETRSAR